MSRFNIRHNGLVPLTLVIALVASMSAEQTFTWGQEPSKNKPEASSDADRLVEALANRNPQPRIVSREEFKDLFIEAYVPLFAKDYDWKEQERVNKASGAVATRASPEMWDRLVAHENDARYWLTLADEAGAAPGSLGSAHNWTVGDYCSQLAYAQLMLPVNRNMDILERERSVNDRGMREPVNLSMPPYGKLRQWRESRPGKTFVELQIEVCQQAIDGLPRLKDISAKAKAEFRARMESEIEQLKKSKAGIFGPVRVFSAERYNWFDAAKAKEIRETYEEAKKRGNITQPESKP
jgi:hypothetical protein